MTYKLAKELEDAGWKFNDWEPLTAQLPTLTELIEACGERFKFLERHYLRDTDIIEWHAGENYSIIARTPDEAVARLWLALNKPI